MIEKIKKFKWLPLLGAVALGVFLRIYNIGSAYFFEGELGRELIYLRQLAIDGRLPLVGLTTSHEWLSYGPFYYWIMMPFFKISGGHPFVLFWVGLLAAVSGMIVGYKVIEKIINRKVALISTLIMAISPLLIAQARNSKLHLFFLILIPVFMYLLNLVWDGKKKWIFWAGLTFGFMFSFHFSQIPLLGVVVLLFWIKKNIYKFKDWLKFAAGVIIPNITYLWQDKNLALWLPYRTLNLENKNPVGTVNAFLEYLGSNFFWDRRLWTLGLVIFLAIFAHYIWRERKNFTKNFVPFYLISSIGLMLLANILHGAFPIHYFLPIYATVPVLLAIYASKSRFGLFIIAAFFLINLGGYLQFNKPEGYVLFERQVAAADFIVTDAKGSEVSIRRLGPYDYFPEQYSQGYKYLVMWRGGRLVENSANVYTIVESKGEIYVQK